MKPPKSFAGMAMPKGWHIFGSGGVIEKMGPYRVVSISICCNEGHYWDYYDHECPHMGFTKFDASGCETLEEVCALVEVLVRMS